jgi:capsular exopolysaccharide synthesis family protein
MTYRDDPPHRTDEQHALVTGTHQPGDALMVQSTNGAPTPSVIIPNTPVPPGQDVLRGGMDANTFLHAIRRRWLLALCMGSVAAAACATALWFIFPESTSATALFEVSNDETAIFDISRKTRTIQDFDILKKTQLAKLKSNYVLTAAVRNPGIASLSALAGEPDPVEWLQENLIVDFPQNGEILAISLTDDVLTEDLVRLVDAVAKAYKDEVIGAERQRRLATRDLLNRNLENLNGEIKSGMEEYLAIAKDSGRSQGSQRDAETEILLRNIAEISKKKDDLTSQLYQTQTEFMIMKSELEDPALLEAQVDEMLEKDPQLEYMKQQLMMVQMQQSQAASGARHGSRAATQYDRSVQSLTQQIDRYKSETKAKAIRENQLRPNLPLQQLTKRFKTTAGSLQQQLALVTKTLDGKMTELRTRVERSTDLETREEKLKQLQEIASDMSVKLESLDIDANAPDQIHQVQQAVPVKNINTTEHYAIASVGGVVGFALTCLGIGYLEFRHRKLNVPNEVDEGLGIRVVGTLPGLSSRKALDPSHPIVAQLTESIDGVRTILMHDSSSKRRQVVLVTSPATMEGRTTVASQLAASLARAGRRTLLVDGDLRRPALHALFDVPLEDGLSEVLRAEVDVSDVIRPTHAEGLWLLTAGYCDIDAIHALATEQMQPVFDKLRGEYDFIIIDGAPVLGMSDALIFGQYSDGAILSVRRDQSQMPKIHQAAELLRGVGIRIIGAVVNGVQAKADDRIVQMRLMAPKSERELQATS